MRAAVEVYDDDLPDLDPVVFSEVTGYGWRGLTSEGEVLEVRSNGKAEVPDSMVVAFRGRPIGRRRVTNDWKVDIDAYLHHFNRVVDLYKSNDIEMALREAELTLLQAPTLRAKFNRAMVLLAAGRWREGLTEYWICEQSKPFVRPQVERALAMGMKPWMGEPLTGKRLLLLHAHGFGDTIMTLRYVPRLKKSIMIMPMELHALAGQLGLVLSEPVDCDFFCPMFHLLYLFNVVPEQISGEPYLHAPARYADSWKNKLGEKRKKRIGVAWSIGKPSDGDYPREIDLGELVDRLGGKRAEFHSVQTQGSETAIINGVIPHSFENFADCAGFMSCMDEIISVDTAALHLAGAIGHPNVIGLLSHWASWRWQAKWYDNVRLLKQTSSGDWATALAQC